MSSEVDASARAPRSTGRTYGGEAPQDRRDRRRRQLLDAGLEVFGTVGYRRATVRALCREARVADRYFYQDFAGTEELLLAVYAECLDRLQQVVLDSVAARGEAATARDLATAGVESFLACAQGDPRLARVVWFEVLGVSPRVEAAYMERTRTFADLLLQLLEDGGASRALAPAQRGVVAYTLVGGISQVVLRWVYDDFAPPAHDLVEPLVALVLAGASLEVPAAPAGSR